jgi:hypothetical protein
VKYSNRFIILVCCAVAVFCIVPLFLLTRVVLGPNDASRWDTVWSLTHGKDYVIDESPYWTVDMVYNHGHYYSTKPALLPALVAAIASLASSATGATLPNQDYILIPIILIVINALPFVLVIYYFGKWLDDLPYSDFTKAFCLITAAFGTYLTAYNISLNNHTVAAVAVMLTIIIGSRIITDHAQNALHFCACGVLSAWVGANELPAGFFCVLTFGYLWKIDKVKTLKFFAPGALIVTILFFGCTFWATGGFVPYYLRKELYYYPGSFWNHPQGISAAKDSLGVYILNFIVGHHGIISLSPVLLFGLLGMFSHRTSAPLRSGAIFLTVINCAFVFSTTHDYGGHCQGPRWFMWLIPIWLFCMPPVAERLSGSTLGKCILIESLLWSFGSICYAIFASPYGPWGVSWLHQLMFNYHLTDYSGAFSN